MVKIDREKIAFHKGVLVSLVAERRELVRMLTHVNGLMMAHIKQLRDMGVDFKKEIKLEVVVRK